MTRKFTKIRKDVNKILEDVSVLKNNVDLFDIENKKDFDCNIKMITSYLNETKMIVARDEEYKKIKQYLREAI